jgi:hypothetical protein
MPRPLQRLSGAYLVTNTEPYSLFMHLCDPSLDIFSRPLSRKNDPAMLFRRQPDRQPTRKGLIWLLASLSTKREIILDTNLRMPGAAQPPIAPEM